ncbi:uncharacterized protein MONBRDRAFT_38264 [Monosiga brevicollis MX1]|uniref:BZIP domain-containing protein n=1 Tax=Monosiga brevicollis TaxID=81824 RepID=A9V6T7_MONBE|nr:uncharacterized protein MONBRDRAFT_38264 [Monosiga brevicollis MX1]EDQ86791.1 predicted protein [Monosiga brevicollis MX1]|eukprot:XP_001748336.1 hypothetical protein [Monosiga brevicollis MX1]
MPASDERLVALQADTAELVRELGLDVEAPAPPLKQERRKRTKPSAGLSKAQLAEWRRDNNRTAAKDLRDRKRQFEEDVSHVVELAEAENAKLAARAQQLEHHHATMRARLGAFMHTFNQVTKANNNNSNQSSPTSVSTSGGVSPSNFRANVAAPTSSATPSQTTSPTPVSPAEAGPISAPAWRALPALAPAPQAPVAGTGSSEPDLASADRTIVAAHKPAVLTLQKELQQLVSVLLVLVGLLVSSPARLAMASLPNSLMNSLMALPRYRSASASSDSHPHSQATARPRRRALPAPLSTAQQAATTSLSTPSSTASLTTSSLTSSWTSTTMTTSASTMTSAKRPPSARTSPSNLATQMDGLEPPSSPPPRRSRRLAAASATNDSTMTNSKPSSTSAAPASSSSKTPKATHAPKAASAASTFPCFEVDGVSLDDKDKDVKRRFVLAVLERLANAIHAIDEGDVEHVSHVRLGLESICSSLVHTPNLVASQA